MCSTSDASDSKKMSGEWVGMEQQVLMPNIISVSGVRQKYNYSEIQARDVSDIAPYPSPMYHMLKRLNQHRFKWYFIMTEYSQPANFYLIHGSANTSVVLVTQNYN